MGVSSVAVSASLKIGGRSPLCFIVGPCVIESRKSTLQLARRIKSLSEELQVPVVFKASYDKANRSSIDSYRGPGLQEGCQILSEVRESMGLPVTTDVHRVEDVSCVAQAVDIVQIPAFLCRQTDLLVAVAQQARVVNIKKGQFLAPGDMRHVIEKVRRAGNKKVLVTERGTCFGYNTLISDMRAFPIMREFGVPVVFDVTHSLQRPGGRDSDSGGDPQYIFPLARAAVAAGCSGVFVETHVAPSKALSDGASMLAFNKLKALMLQLKQLDELVRGRCYGKR